jgi:Flavodoxin domain
MNALVVYESMFGNTEQVARAVAHGLSRQVTTDTLPVRQASATVAADYDLIVVGGPTHAFSMSRPGTREEAQHQGAHSADAKTGQGIREWLATIPTHADGRLAAAFDTRVAKARRLPGSAAKKADKVLGKHGMTHLARPESFFVEDTPGPLLDGELARAEAWGEQLGRELRDRMATTDRRR